MERMLTDYQVINSLCDQDEKSPTRFNLNFWRIALACQQYSEDSHLNQQERHCQLKACTNIIAILFSEVISGCEHKASSKSACNYAMLS